MATVGSAIVCDYMETALFAIVCHLRSAIRDRLRSFAIIWKPAFTALLLLDRFPRMDEDGSAFWELVSNSHSSRLQRLLSTWRPLLRKPRWYFWSCFTKFPFVFALWGVSLVNWVTVWATSFLVNLQRKTDRDLQVIPRGKKARNMMKNSVVKLSTIFNY